MMPKQPISPADPALPFLKWPGGKRWLAEAISILIGETIGNYYEPFVGGGAVFFHLRPLKAVLSDQNRELIGVYRQVKTNVEGVLDAMSTMRPSRKQYLKFRDADPAGAVDRAVRFLYLNRTAFNGMYRVNRQGQFNVPYGCKPGTKIVNQSLLCAASEALQAAVLRHSSFEQEIPKAGGGDTIYCDPPYTVKHNHNGFVRYNESIFSWDDQIKLAECCHAAVRRGARVIVSNARHDSVRKLYRGFTLLTVHRKSMVSGSLKGRGTVAEYLMLSKNIRPSGSTATPLARSADK